MRHNALNNNNVPLYPNEEKLAAQLRAGSVKAFEAIYDLYVNRLYAYCFEAIRIKQETEEVVHDVFMSLWDGRGTVEPKKGVGALLYSIARKRRIDAFRRLVNSPVYEDYVELQNTLPSGDEAPMEYDDFARTFRKVLDGMPPRMRTLIILSKIDEMNNHEIAERLGVAEKTIRNQLSLALKELYARISPFIDGDKNRTQSGADAPDL